MLPVHLIEHNPKKDNIPQHTCLYRSVHVFLRLSVYGLSILCHCHMFFEKRTLGYI